MIKPSHKLSGAIEGALAGGGDPATSPLYVFGPFLRLITVAGVASVVFGPAIWLAVITVAVVSGMYRLVMIWVTDGTGGTGLNEEEFGEWAVTINAGITVVEYTLTFLVSVAALVTFLADRFPVLDQSFFGLSLGTATAVGASVLIGFVVNRGPRIAARTFGPATGAVLLLLWTMIGATIWRYGLRWPSWDWAAFSSANIGVTLGGYARILALMTGIEIFANLVAAYDGSARVRSRKAFGSLAIVMGTTALTMLIVGPAVYDLADASNQEVSVFTQTMDRLLPAPLPYIGTLIGVAVLFSAAAASAQGIQNLSLGLRYRHYVPPFLGERNASGVAGKPVWAQVAVCVGCFVVFGTEEDTYLALYAAGVFILLSLTGWAAVKRLARGTRRKPSLRGVAAIAATGIAASLTSCATLIIFEERFAAGAWVYFVIIPAFYVIFRRIRRQLGAPRSIDDRLGKAIASSNLPPNFGDALYAGVSYANIMVPLDLSPGAELALAQAQTMARNYTGTIRLLTVLEGDAESSDGEHARVYLEDVAEDLGEGGYHWQTAIRRGSAASEIGGEATAEHTDLIIMTMHGQSQLSRWVAAPVPTQVLHQTTAPVLLIRPTETWQSTRTRFRRILATLDGSETSEYVLPHVHEIGSKFGGQVTLLAVSEGSQDDTRGDTLRKYLSGVAKRLSAKGVAVSTRLETSAPTQAILSVCEEERIDLVMMTAHGTGGLERQDPVKLGSVVSNVIQRAPCPVFVVSGRLQTQNELEGGVA